MMKMANESREDAYLDLRQSGIGSCARCEHCVNEAMERVVELEGDAEKARAEASGQFWAADEVTELRARVAELQNAGKILDAAHRESQTGRMDAEARVTELEIRPMSAAPKRHGDRVRLVREAQYINPTGSSESGWAETHVIGWLQSPDHRGEGES